MYDQAALARRIMYCYVRAQNARGGYLTFEEYGQLVAEVEGRRDRAGELDPYSASTAQAWTVPGGSIPGVPAQLAIARLAGADVDPGWVTYGEESAAPEPPGVDLFPTAPGRRRRRR